MSSFFSSDNIVMRFLENVCNFIILNLLTLLCCLPVFTAGASVTAMYTIALRWARGEDGYIVKPFFKAFKENFKQAFVEWLIVMAAVVVFAADFWMFSQMPEAFPQVLKIIIIVLAVAAFLIAQWIFLLQCRFYNPVKQTLKNALLMTILQLPRTVGMALCWVVSFGLIYLSLVSELNAVFPVVLLLFLSVPGYLVCKLAVKPLAGIEPEPEQVPEKSEGERMAEEDEAYRVLSEENPLHGGEAKED